MSGGRRHLVGARVHGSMKVRGGGGGAVPVRQASLRRGLHLCGDGASQRRGGRGPRVHRTRGRAPGWCGVVRLHGRRWQWVGSQGMGVGPLLVGRGLVMRLIVLTVEVLHGATALAPAWGGVMTRARRRGRGLHGRLWREVAWSGGPALWPRYRCGGGLPHHRRVGDVGPRRGRRLWQLPASSSRRTRPRRGGHRAAAHRTAALSMGEALSAFAGGAGPSALPLSVAGVSVSVVPPIPSVGDVALLVHRAVVMVMVVVVFAVLGASTVSVL